MMLKLWDVIKGCNKAQEIPRNTGNQRFCHGVGCPEGSDFNYGGKIHKDALSHTHTTIMATSDDKVIKVGQK